MKPANPVSLAKIGCLALVVACSLLSGVQAFAEDPTELEIIKPRVNVTSGNRILGYVTKGSRYKIYKVDGSNYQIQIRIGGQVMRGYVPESDVRLIGGTSGDSAVVDTTPGWLRVTAAKAEVKDDETVLRTVRQGEVHQITGANAGKVRIEFERVGANPWRGWVAESDIEKLPQRFVGPSLDQHMPHSISTSKLVADWIDGTAVLFANPPLADNSQVELAPNGGPIGIPAASIDRAEAGIEIRLPSTSVHHALRAGTRSLWLVETLDGQKRYHRIDLPKLELSTQVGLARSEDPAEGVVLTLGVEGLLPGFVVEHACPIPSAGDIEYLAQYDGKPTVPRVLKVAAGEGSGAVLSLGLPRADGKTQEIVHLLTIRNPDGSLAQSVKVRRRGDSVNGEVQVVSAAKPRPVDSVVSVPAVELMKVEAARSAASDSGLVPLLVKATDGSPAGDELPPETIVLRQGLVAGSSALLGEALVLEVGDEAAANQMTSSPLEFVTGGGLVTSTVDAPNTGNTAGNPPEQGPVTSPAENSPLINTGDELQFIDVSQTGLISGDDGLISPNTNDPTPPLDDPPLVGDVPNTGITNPDAGNPGGGVISIDDDPGVLLDPQVDHAAAVLIGILKVVIDAILKQPDPGNLPGAIGQAITQAIQTQDQNLHQNDPAKVASAVGSILEIVAQRLQITLTPSQSLDALNAWQAAHPPAGGSVSLDQNLNGVAADDVVIFFLGWLQQQGLFNPAANVMIAKDSLGNTIAILSNKPHSTDWLQQGLPPIVIPGLSQPPSVGPASSAPPTVPPKVDPLASISAADATVTAGDAPDQVCIPELIEQIVKTSKPKLEDLGLKIANLLDLFESDRIDASDPEQETWVAVGSSITLNTSRRVPDVTKFSLADAEQLLRTTKLEPRPVGESGPSDIIIEQQPAAGSFAAAGQAVKLTLAVQTPAVIDLLLSEAETELKDRGLGWHATTKSFSTDKVVEQSPPAGALVARGEQVKLTVHVAVPDVRNLSLANAREKLQELDLQPENASARAIDKDTVRGQSPAPKTYVRHGETVRLGPIVSVLPDVRGMKVSEASTLLRDEEKYLVEMVGTCLPTDVITVQDPEGGTEYERGSTVKLDVRVKLPDYVGDNLLESRDAIAALPGGLSVRVDGALGRSDVVHSQSPQGNRRVPPRTEVTLVPGVRVPNFSDVTTQRADEMLQSAGLRGSITVRGSRETTNRALVGNMVVESQSPRSGIYRRSDVDLVRLNAVRMELAVRTVPNVLNEPSTSAVARIQSAELTPIIMYQGQAYNKDAWSAFLIAKTLAEGIAGRRYSEPRVGSQNPRSGASVEAGSQVRIFVSDAEAR